MIDIYVIEETDERVVMTKLQDVVTLGETGDAAIKTLTSDAEYNKPTDDMNAVQQISILSKPSTMSITIDKTMAELTASPIECLIEADTLGFIQSIKEKTTEEVKEN